MVAERLGVSEDTVTYWEKNRSSPQVQHYPKIIAYLGYYPFRYNTETLAGKLTQIRHSYGWSYRQCAKMLHISEDAAKRWERGKPIMNGNVKLLIEKIWENLFTTTSTLL
jgi:DNA-binding transcriptional regulator YiaG